jgi:hypothetical protein
VKKESTVFEGYGEQQWPSGARFEGLYKNDSAEGDGRQIFADGDIFEGNFENGKANGKGLLFKPSG